MRWILRPVTLLALILLTVLGSALWLMRLADRSDRQPEGGTGESGLILRPRPQAWWPGVETRPG